MHKSSDDDSLGCFFFEFISTDTPSRELIFSWILVFNVGEYRRAVRSHADKNFFDPDNAEAVAVLK